jgi:hypothetical protein
MEIVVGRGVSEIIDGILSIMEIRVGILPIKGISLGKLPVIEIVVGMDIGVTETIEGMLIGGTILIMLGTLIGPTGPIFKYGKTIGGICGVTEGTVMFGTVIKGKFGITGIGISNAIVVVGGCGSLTLNLSIGV